MWIRTIFLILGLSAVGLAASDDDGDGDKLPPIERPAQDIGETRFDDSGVALPVHALARLGGGRFHNGPFPIAVTFHPDSHHFAALDGSGIIRVWHLESGKEVCRWNSINEAGGAARLFYLADGRLCYAVNNTLSTFNPREKIPSVVTLPGRVEAVSPGGRWLLTRQQLGDEQQLSFVDAMIPRHRIGFARQKKADAEDDVAFFAAVSADNSAMANIHKSDKGESGLEVRNVLANRTSGTVPIPASTALGMSGDGRWILVDETGRLRCWQVRLATPQATPELVPRRTIDIADPEPGTTSTIRFARKGPVAYVGRSDGSILEIDVEAGRILRRWHPGPYAIGSIDISPDGRTLIANGAGIHAIDLTSGRERFTGGGHFDSPRWLSFDPDGRTLVSTSFGRVCVWNMTPRSPEDRAAGRQFVGGAPKATMTSMRGGFSVGAFATESRRLFVHTANDMLVVDPDRAKVVRKVFEGLDSANFRCWAYAPDGDSLAVSTTLNSIDRIDAKTGKSIGAKIEGIGKLDDMEMLPDNRTLALLVEGGDVLFRDMRTGGEILPERVDARRGGTDRRFVNSYSFTTDRLAIWDRFSGKMIAQTPPPDEGGEGRENRQNYNNTLSPSGRYAYVIRGPNIVMWEVLTGQRYTLPFFHPKGAFVSHMQTSPDSNLLVTSASNSRIYVWDHDLKRPTKPLSKTEHDDAWATLGKDSLSSAWRAMGELATPAGLARIDAGLKIAVPADPKTIAGLIGDLDSVRFSVRENGSRELLRLSPLAEGQLREALRVTGSQEVSTRLKRILDLLAAAPSSERLRLLRLCEMLEKDASARAIALLGRLKASADLTISISAADALERLRRLPGKGRS